MDKKAQQPILSTKLHAIANCRIKMFSAIVGPGSKWHGTIPKTNLKKHQSFIQKTVQIKQPPFFFQSLKIPYQSVLAAYCSQLTFIKIIWPKYATMCFGEIHNDDRWFHASILGLRLWSRQAILINRRCWPDPVVEWRSTCHNTDSVTTHPRNLRC